MQTEKLPSVKVLFFGATADAAGSREEEMEMKDSTRVRDAVSRLLDRHPRLTAHKLLVAVNEEYVSSDTALNDGDELAVFTAVSGG